LRKSAALKATVSVSFDRSQKELGIALVHQYDKGILPGATKG